VADLSSATPCAAYRVYRGYEWATTATKETCVLCRSILLASKKRKKVVLCMITTNKAVQSSFLSVSRLL
jgi:hypothetical protein